MRAGLRFTTILLAGGLWLMPATALAQNTTEPATSTPTTNTPATNAIGPRELQNFSLPGTTTRPADQPVTTTPTNPPRTTNSSAATTKPAPPRRTPAIRQAASTTSASRPLEAVNSPVTLPPATDAPAAAPQPAVSSAAEPLSNAPAGTLASEHKLPILPWLAAALALAGGTIFLLWRRRPREAYAEGADYDLFVAPEPAPAPPPARRSSQPQAGPPPPELPPVPEPPKSAPKPAASGIVASGLRPALEIGVQPLRCLVADDNVTIEFEIDLFNAGAAPARAVLAEASLFNPGATQEQELAAFFANPVGAGNRLDSIQPMKRVTLTSQVVAPRAAIQEYELAGRKSFVPVIAFNALYEWSGGKGQTSAAYLVGRDTGSEKLGPLRLDPAPREMRRLGARALSSEVRT